MKLTALVKVDSKGRVTIPQAIRQAIGIEPGMVMLLIGDLDRKELFISPLISESAENIYYIELNLKDKPGALAQAASALAELGIDIIASKCTSIIRGEEGMCVIVADFSSTKVGEEGVRRKLEELDVVLQVKIKRFEAGFEEL